MVLHIQIDGLGNLRPDNDGAESPVFPTCRAHRLPMKLRLGCALLLASWGLPGRDLVRIPAQEYDTVDERTGVKTHVRLDAFRIAPTETTQEEYRAITGATPSIQQGPNRPVENVSWWDAIRYCNTRSRRENLAPCYDLTTGRCDSSRNGYRLPTEAEWVVAAADHLSPPAGKLSQIARLGLSDTTHLQPLLARVKLGPAPVAGLAPNRFGLYDILGNVWEWCQDFFDAVRSYPPALNSDGPAPGRARVIRGGSYVTSPSWSKGFRSSMDPDARSPFTGFRVCRRDVPEPQAAPVQDTASWTEVYHRPPPGFESSTGTLTNLLQTSAGPIQTADEWRRHVPELQKKWNTMLGACQPEVREPSLRVLRRMKEPGYTGTLAELEVDPGAPVHIYLMQPESPVQRPMPVVIVPYYDVDTPAGQDLGGRDYVPPGARSFALMAVQRGYLAVAVRWFGETEGESYAEAVANLARRHPGCTGLGKWVADARALVNYLVARPDVDRRRVAIIGHSLGAKMALYAAAFDERIAVAVASEPGIGFKQSNYDSFWYFGDGLAAAPAGTDQHELLGMLAPRPFLLIGGDQYDTAESWRYLNAASPVYALFQAAPKIGYYNHHTGHSPTPEAAWLGMEWIRRFLL